MSVPRWILHVAAVFVPKVRSNLAVDAGDILRDRRNWAEAALCYRRALQICPARVPIWIQLGHVLKEGGEPDQALAAYRAACALPGEDGDALLCLGIMAKRCGHFAEAKAALRRAWQIRPENAVAQSEFLDLLHEPLAVEERTVGVAKALIAAEAVRLQTSAAAGPISVVFDVSDLISYFRHSRLPTGIQRVQIEVIRAALDIHAGAQIGCFSELGGTWYRIPAAHFQDLCALSGASGDRLGATWIDALEILTATLAEKVPIDFAPAAFLVNLGSTWWMPNYFLHIRRLQQARGIHYVPLVHDLIPVIAPDYFVKELVQDFLGWTYDVFKHVDFFLVNSQSTGADLHRVAQTLGYDLAPSHVATLPLNADFRRAERVDVPTAHLAAWRLTQDRFALFVSTVEPRKNHAIVFQAWRDLIARHGADAVPDLVCVGKRGWLNEHVYAALDDDPVLASKVRMLSDVSDEHLALLYRSCLFTVYPSKYEGWGLPVTESLCYGKIPVLCRSSSLPEAGGDFALYFESEDLSGLAAAVERLIFDAAARKALEQRIRNDFIPRTWRSIATQVIDDLGGFMKAACKTPRTRTGSVIALDHIYHFARNHRTRLTGASDGGEQFRSGNGWWQCEDWGCSTSPEGGALVFTVPGGRSSVRCWLNLSGPLRRQSGVTIHCGNREFRCDLQQGECRWISFLADAPDGNVTFVIRGHDSVDLTIMTGYRDRRNIGVGISLMIVTEREQSRSLIAIAQRLSAAEQGAFEFFRDAYLLLVNRHVNEWDLQDHFPLLENGEMSKIQIIEKISKSSEYWLAAERLIMFD